MRGQRQASHCYSYIDIDISTESDSTAFRQITPPACVHSDVPLESSRNINGHGTAASAHSDLPLESLRNIKGHSAMHGTAARHLSANVRSQGALLATGIFEDINGHGTVYLHPRNYRST